MFVLRKAPADSLARVQRSRISPTVSTESDYRAIASLLVVGGALATFLLTMLWVGGARIGLLEAAITFVGALVIGTSGELVLRLAGLDAMPARAPAAIVIGTIATSLSVLAGVLVTGFRAGPVFLGWTAIVAATFIATRHRISWRGRPDDLSDCVIVASLAVLVAFWCRRDAAAFPMLTATGVLPVWVDYYIHGATIAQFGSSLAVGGSIEVAGQPLPLYHYGPFMIAAAIGGVTDVPGLGLAGAVLLPVGLLVAALGSYALAATLAGPLAGALAVAFLALLPDASFYGLGNGFFGFHWLLFTAPGSGYALGAAAVALILANEWLRDRNLYAAALAIVLIAAVFQLRILFLPVLLPAFTIMLACETAFVRRHMRMLMWLAFGAGALTLALLLAAPVVRNFWLEHSVVTRFLELVHQGNQPTAYDGLYAGLVASVGKTAAIPVGIALLLPLLLGGFVLLYPAALIAWIRRAGWQTFDLFPPLLLLTYIAVVLLAPMAPNGSDSEFQHRPFVLVYQVVAIWSAAYLCRIAFGGNTDNLPFARSAVIAVAAASILTGWLTGFEPGRPKSAWSKLFYRIPIAQGVVEAAAFVRHAARPGDIIAVVPVDPKATLIDLAIEVVGLTDGPSYLARPGIQMIQGGPHRREVTIDRIARLGEVEAATDPATAFVLLRQMGVTWYIRVGPEGPRFDPNRSRTAYATANATVYRIEPDKPVK